MNSDLSEEQELQQFIELTRFPGTKEVLLHRLTSLQKMSRQEQEKASILEEKKNAGDLKESHQSPPIKTAAPSTTAKVPSPPSVRLTYVPIDAFSWEQGEYNTPTVTVYVDIPGVGSVKE